MNGRAGEDAVPRVESKEDFPEDPPAAVLGWPLGGAPVIEGCCMGPIEILALIMASCAAGIVNAIAGGGTLITFPVLILFGIPPVIANATSTLSLVVGTAGSLYSFRSMLAEVRPWFATFIPVSIAGGWLGSFFLTHGSERVFSSLVPWLILFATLLFMVQGVVRHYASKKVLDASVPSQPGELKGSGRVHLFVAVLFQFIVSVYGGYFLEHSSDEHPQECARITDQPGGRALVHGKRTDRLAQNGRDDHRRGCGILPWGHVFPATAPEAGSPPDHGNRPHHLRCDVLETPIGKQQRLFRNALLMAAVMLCRPDQVED